MSEKDGISVNFFVDGSYNLITPDGKPAEVIQQTDYPVSGNISLKLVLAKEEQLKVRIRIPLWSQNSVLTVNGQPVENVVPGKFAEISRTWKSGDEISLAVDMRGRIVHMGELPENLAIVRGPIVLTRDARLGTPHVDETIKPLLDKEGFIKLEPAGTNRDGIWMKYKGSFMVESHMEGDNKPVEIIFCDYASAGNTIDEHSWFRVWLPQSFDPRK